MSSKILVGVCALFMVQTSSAQCINPCAIRGLSYAPELTSNGGFFVQSSSPIAPTGITVLSERLLIEGPLLIDGEMPFLGSVIFDGTLPTTGAGTVTHSCGGSAIGMSSESAPRGPIIVPGAGLLGPVFGAGPIVGPALGTGPIAGPVLPFGAGPPGAATFLGSPLLGLSPALGAGSLVNPGLAGTGLGLGCGRGLLV